MEVKLYIGDVLLFPREKIVDIEDYAKQVLGDKVSEWLAKVTGYRYAHAELYVGNGYLLGAWYNGVALYRPNIRAFRIAHIYRHPEITDEHRFKMRDLVDDVLKTAGYDYTSFILNALITLLSFNLEVLEQFLESRFPYDDPKHLICSELVARVFENVGLKIERKAEFVTPDDLAEYLERVV